MQHCCAKNCIRALQTTQRRRLYGCTHVHARANNRFESCIVRVTLTYSVPIAASGPAEKPRVVSDFFFRELFLAWRGNSTLHTGLLAPIGTGRVFRLFLFQPPNFTILFDFKLFFLKSTSILDVATHCISDAAPAHTTWQHPRFGLGFNTRVASPARAAHRHAGRSVQNATWHNI